MNEIRHWEKYDAMSEDDWMLCEDQAKADPLMKKAVDETQRLSYIIVDLIMAIDSPESKARQEAARKAVGVVENEWWF